MAWNSKPSSPLRRLLVALLIVAAACAFRLVFFGSLGSNIPFLLYFPAVTLAALYGGLLTGLLVTVLSAGLVYFWINQGHLSPPEWLAMAVFVISGALISYICEIMLRSLQRERLAREEAEAVSQKLRIEMAERQQTQTAMIASEMRYRRLFEAARDGVLILDAATGMVVDVNPYLIELLGVTREVFLGKKVWELGFFKDIVANEANFVELQQKQFIRYENMALEGFDGKRHEVEFVSNVYLVDGHKVVQCNIRDISERVRTTLALLEKNSELERFLYTTSHDLKSPVVTVRTFISYLEQDLAAADAGKIKKDINFIREAADKIWLLLNGVLEIGRIGRVVSPPVRMTFRQLANDALASVAGQISKGGVTVQLGDGDVALFGDRLRLSEVFQNLLDNACKFMDGQQAPRIEIGFEMRDAETVFFVRDNGIGIDPRHQVRLFGLFEKLNPQTEGAGMGLAITKRIVELNKGRIWIECPGVGQGACFYFTLPGAIQKTKTGEKL